MPAILNKAVLPAAISRRSYLMLCPKQHEIPISLPENQLQGRSAYWALSSIFLFLEQIAYLLGYVRLSRRILISMLG